MTSLPRSSGFIVAESIRLALVQVSAAAVGKNGPVATWVASFFGAGLVLRQIRGRDLGSGTVGALVAAMIAYLIPSVSGRLVAAVVFVAAGLWATRQLGFRGDDPSWVVVDEAAAVFVATIGLTQLPMLVAFLVFRVADIGKRWFPGVAAAENVGGPVGIMADDLVAALYGLAAGWVVQTWAF